MPEGYSTINPTLTPRRVPDGAGRAESLAAAQLPEGARGSRAALCPPASAGEREYVAAGARDGGVVVWDASRAGQPPIVVNKLQARAYRAGCLQAWRLLTQSGLRSLGAWRADSCGITSVVDRTGRSASAVMPHAYVVHAGRSQTLVTPHACIVYAVAVK